MYFLPSYGRPKALPNLLKSPGGMPDKANLVVIVNEDDPARADYLDLSPWPILFCPAGSRFTDTWRFVHEKFPELKWYGMLGDDHVPQTAGWHEVLVCEAGSRFLAYPNGAHTEFPLMRGVCVLGGELVGQLGWIVPPGFQHHYIDCVLDDVCRDAGLLKPCVDVRVDHLHWSFGLSQIDETYARGRQGEGEDCMLYHSWRISQERLDLSTKLHQWKATWPSEAPAQ